MRGSALFHFQNVQFSDKDKVPHAVVLVIRRFQLDCLSSTCCLDKREAWTAVTVSTFIISWQHLSKCYENMTNFPEVIRLFVSFSSFGSFVIKAGVWNEIVHYLQLIITRKMVWSTLPMIKEIQLYRSCQTLACLVFCICAMSMLERLLLFRIFHGMQKNKK